MQHSPEVFLGNPSAGQHASLHKVFEAQVINALGGEDNIGTRRKQLLNALLAT